MDKKNKLTYNFLDVIPNLVYLHKWGLAKGTEKFIYLGGRFVPNCIKKHNDLGFVFIVFVVISSPFLFLYPLVKTVWNISFSKRKPLKSNKVFLYTSVALPRVAKNAALYDNASCWLGYPENSPERNSIEGFVSVYSVVSFRDAFFTYFKSLQTIVDIINKYNIRYALASFWAFKWYLMGCAVIKTDLDTELLFCSTNDIYQLLYDKLPHHKKTLIQHGTLIIKRPPKGLKKEDIILVDDVYVQNIPYKFENLTTVYAFSEKEYHALKVAVINNNPTCIIVGYPLRIDESLYKKNSVLVIGYYPEHSAKEEAILSALQDTNTLVYLKNHPTVSPHCYNEFKGKYNFTLLCGNVWPDVDLVISYDSTLAREYLSLGYTVIYYEDFCLNDARNVILDRLR